MLTEQGLTPFEPSKFDAKEIYKYEHLEVWQLGGEFNNRIVIVVNAKNVLLIEPTDTLEFEYIRDWVGCVYIRAYRHSLKKKEDDILYSHIIDTDRSDEDYSSEAEEVETLIIKAANRAPCNYRKIDS